MIRPQSLHAFVAAITVATVAATADAEIGDAIPLPMPQSRAIQAATPQTSVLPDHPPVSYARALERREARAVLRDVVPMTYADGGDPIADYPAYVRASSAVRRWKAGLVVVQDDVNVLALRDRTGAFRPLLLPQGEGGRRQFDDSLGNKAAKLDLEAGVVLPDGRFVALGSGSTARREHIAVAWPDGEIDLREAGEFYDLLRNTPQFAGAELNLEGAVVVGERLRLLQRGNGAPTETTPAVNATADIDLADWVRWLDGEGPLPPLLAVVQYDLGTVDGVPLCFTDAAALSPEMVVFLAGAEASADAANDGAVADWRVGVIDGEGVWIWKIRNERGEPVRLKLEGIEPLDEEGGDLLRFTVVSDVDRPDQPALIGTLELDLDGPAAVQIESRQ
jgi:hypothetical protein